MKNVFIDTTATREFFLSSDTEKSIVWLLGALDSRLVLHILGKNHDSPSWDGSVNQVIDFVRFGLKGAKGLEDAEGKPLGVPFEEVDVPFVGKRQAVSDSLIRILRPDFLIELGLAIRADNILTEDERKKSFGLSQSSETLGS